MVTENRRRRRRQARGAPPGPPTGSASGKAAGAPVAARPRPGPGVDEAGPGGATIEGGEPDPDTGDGTQVGPGTVVGLGYAIYDAEGELIEESAPDEPLTYIHGYGQLLPALEAAVEGMVAGQERSAWLDEHDAFGPHDPTQIFEVDRDEFPDPGQVQVGDEFGVEGEGGGFSLRVIEVLPDGFVVDANHPLAGQRVRVRARVEHVRPATGGELNEAEAALEASQAGGDGPNGAPAGARPGGLLSAESLLRRGGPGRA
jgi:FKBP-type peptidyl-prolyl cis-trans isomerase SlyD